MYVPPHFKIAELSEMHGIIRAARLANLVTQTSEGLVASPLPLLLDPSEGEFGTLYGHVAKANPQGNPQGNPQASPQGQSGSAGDALAIFMGPDAYITPSWYATKREHGRVVPTWNYLAVHVYGPVEFFQDEDRLRDVVTRLTDLYEQPRHEPWKVTDAPDNFIKGQLRGIVGLRMPIVRIDGKCKMSQNRNLQDRVGVVNGLAGSEAASDRHVAALIPTTPAP